MTHGYIAFAWTVVFTWSGAAQAYPEFQRHIQSSSGQVVSCALCHSHPDGPDGSKHGQLESLSARELELLAQSRGQLEPGPIVNNPVLNEFGDYLVASLGRNRLMALRPTPELLGASMAAGHDQDQDGIDDARELREGTDPTDPRHGHPARLLSTNMRRHWTELVLAAAATLLGLFGLRRVLAFFAAVERRRALHGARPQSREETSALATRAPNH
jgi:cytochrome c553